MRITSPVEALTANGKVGKVFWIEYRVTALLPISASVVATENNTEPTVIFSGTEYIPSP